MTGEKCIYDIPNKWLIGGTKRSNLPADRV